MNPWRTLALFAVTGLACGTIGCARSSRDASAASKVPGSLERVVCAPSSIAFVSSDRAQVGLGGEIRFGGALGRSALYLKFASEWLTRGIPVRAILSLSPREGSAISDAPLTLEAWRISADWQPRELRHWSDKPNLAPPYARTRYTPSPPRELRIDVSELVRFAAQNPERDFGIAVIASGSEGPGATFSTGFAQGRTPHLELYLPAPR